MALPSDLQLLERLEQLEAITPDVMLPVLVQQAAAVESGWSFYRVVVMWIVY